MRQQTFHGSYYEQSMSRSRHHKGKAPRQSPHQGQGINRQQAVSGEQKEALILMPQPAPKPRIQRPTVSLCTVTQNRKHLLPLLEQCILNQTYNRSLIEWVIVDDSDPGQPEFTPQQGTELRIRMVTLDSKVTLGKKRNLSHGFCNGDIIVYMDDDEYYPPKRIEHAIEKLNTSGKEIAGATNLPILFIPERELWISGPFGENHATANTFAFRRSLLEKTKYEDGATHAEEKKFLKDYSIPLAQLDPKDTLICFGHSTNTFDKRRLIGQGNNPRMRKLEISTIGDWIAPDLVDRYIHAHQRSNRRQEPLMPMPAPGTPFSAPGSKDLNLILLCSPPSSGEALIQEVLRKLGSLIISGKDEAQGVVAAKLLNTRTLERRKPHAEIKKILKVFKDQLIQFRQQTPQQPLLLRDPYAAPIIGELREALGMRLIICLRPITEIANDKRGNNLTSTVDAGLAHQLYGHLFSAITNSDIPFIMVRHNDMKANSKKVVHDLTRFCGLHPSQSQLDDAIQWIGTQCNTESQ